MNLPKNLALLAILAVAPRLLFFLLVQPWDAGVESGFILKSDAHGYHVLALSILDGRFGHDEALRTPGYPAFIAAVYFLAGPRPWAVLLIQCFLDAATCLLVAGAIGGRVGTIAGGFYALNPFTIFYANTLMSEPLLLLCLASAMYLFRRERFVAVGVALGLAALVKPIALYLPALFALWLVFRNRRAAMRVLVASAILVTPWLARNYVAFCAFGFSTSPSYNLLMLHAARVVSVRDGISLKAAQDRLLDQNQGNPFDVARERRTVALRILGAEPMLAVHTYAAGLARMFANLNTGGVANAVGVKTANLNVVDDTSAPEYLRQFVKTRGRVHYVVAAVTAAYLIMLYLSTLAGLSNWRRYRLWLAVAAYFVILAGAAGLARFGLPALLFYLPAAGAGASRVIRRK